MPTLILASSSPYRRQLLARLGLPFESCAPACDEESLKDPALAPQALAEHLAEAKARSIARLRPQDTVIGSDQLAEIDGRILGKPGTAERAIEQLLSLSGRSHRLITAVCICQGERCERHTDITTLRMRELDRAAIERSVAADQPLDCAGAYKLEAGGITLFDRIDSADHSAITGLPLIAVTSLLRQLGWRLP